ncbi:MAG: MCE family protein [Verrucomicrobia bacterium]|nr:MCE family protein [Verrucomicrobiota bacterium]
MTQPLKFRYVNEIVGGFILLVLIVLLAGIYLAGKAQGWFEPTLILRTQFHEDGAFGLKEGAEVHVLGTLVGTVSRIEPGESGQMEGKLRIRGDFARYIRSDSVAIAKKKFAVAGDSYIEITRGKGAELPSDDPFIECRKDTEITERVEEVVEQVRAEILPALEQLRKALEEYTGLAQDLRDKDGSLQQLFARLDRIAEGLEKGEGTAGRLLRDPDVAEGVAQSVQKLNASLADVQMSVKDLREVTAQLPKMTRTISGEIDQLPDVVLEARRTMDEANRLLAGLQRHWLIRKYVDEASEASENVSASDVIGLGGAIR